MQVMSQLGRPVFLLLLLLCISPVGWCAQTRQIGIIDIPGQPGFEEAVFANGMLVMSHAAGNSLDIYDPARRRVVAQVTGLAGPHGLVVDPRRMKLYVSNSRGSSIAVVSSKDWKIERTIALQADPYNLALAPDGLRLYAANWRDRSVSLIDLGADDKATTKNVAGSPQALVFDNTRKVLFVSLQDTAEVIAIDPSTFSIVSRYKLTASQPTAMALSVAERKLYVAVRHAIITLDADTGAETARATAPIGVDSLWLDQAAGMLYVASGGGFVNLYRTRGGLSPLQEIRTAVRGQTVAFDPSRKLIYIPGGREGRSKLLILQQLPLADSNEHREQAAAR